MTYTLLGIIAVLTVLDIITTKLALDKGARELNPVVKFILDKAGYFGFAMTKVAFLGYLYYLGTGVYDWVLGAIIVMYLIVVYNNYRVYKGLK